MDDEFEEESFKRALFNKVRKVNHLVNDITIGPYSLTNLTLDRSPNTSTPKAPSPKATEPKNASSSPVIDHGLPKNQFLKLLYLEGQEKAQSALSDRLNLFEQFSKTQEEQSKESWLISQQRFIQDMERQEMHIIEASKKYDLQQATQQAKLAQMSQDAFQRMKQKQEMLKEKERQIQIFSELINKIKLNQQKFSSEFQEILGLLKGCANREDVKASDLDFRVVKNLNEEMDGIIQKCKTNNITAVTEKEGQKSDEIVTNIIDFKEKFKVLVELINKKHQQTKAEEKNNKQGQKIADVPKPVIAEAPPAEPSSSVTAKVAKTDTAEPQKPISIANLNRLSKYVSIKDLQAYTELMHFYDEYKNSFSKFENDQSLKTFKFDCKKAINIPVNALSGVNSEHIRDKYKKLHKLLNGETVIVSDKQINATRHPQGIPFCMDLLARKFVLQGDLMVSSNPESAFCYASVIVSLWNDFPDFGRLLLANFYKTCPYLVPYYIPKQVGETDEEFYMKLGYQYSDGEVEKQDKFLKRMSGIMKLYFSIMIAKPKKGQNLHPFNLKHGWKWLASFLRLEPQLDITATALHVFLETVGFEMKLRYGNIFQKLLIIIIQVFLPKCKEVKCTGGAVIRLELMLTNYLKNGKFDKPNGYVEYSYW